MHEAVARVVLLGIVAAGAGGCSTALPAGDRPQVAAAPGAANPTAGNPIPAGNPTPGPSPRQGGEEKGEAATTSAAPVVEAAPAQADEPAQAGEPPQAGPIPPGTVVLHVGDSFALAGFAQALKPRMRALGVRYEVRSETSSFTTTWSARMERLVADTQPDLVIINLGANEVLNVDPAAHAPAVRRIVKAIGGRPCVWVSAPSWRKDTGINDVIRENSAPCRFFDSDSLVAQPIARQADHIHPTEQGGAVWAGAFWSWLDAARAPDRAAAGRPSPWRLKAAEPAEHRAHTN
jgi:lysophospholipase L1-like esterase